MIVFSFVNTDFSYSIVARNLGGQIKAFGDKHEKVPFSLQTGFTKGFSHAPFRISVTLIDLTRWKSDYYFNPEKDESFGTILMNHFVAGVDFLPTDFMYVSLGYNFRRAHEMKVAGSSHWAGFSAGAGIQLSKFKFGLAYAQYHLSTPSLVFNAAYSL